MASCTFGQLLIHGKPDESGTIKLRISPSSARGEPKGSWVEANAHVVEAEAYASILGMLRMKYGLLFWFLSHLHGKERVIFELEPAPSMSSSPRI
jgi:hypothetical protein